LPQQPKKPAEEDHAPLARPPWLPDDKQRRRVRVGRTRQNEQSISAKDSTDSTGPRTDAAGGREQAALPGALAEPADNPDTRPPLGSTEGEEAALESRPKRVAVSYDRDRRIVDPRPDPIPPRRTFPLPVRPRHALPPQDGSLPEFADPVDEPAEQVEHPADWDDRPATEFGDDTVEDADVDPAPETVWREPEAEPEPLQAEFESALGEPVPPEPEPTAAAALYESLMQDLGLTPETGLDSFSSAELPDAAAPAYEVSDAEEPMAESEPEFGEAAESEPAAYEPPAAEAVWEAEVLEDPADFGQFVDQGPEQLSELEAVAPEEEPEQRGFDDIEMRAAALLEQMAAKKQQFANPEPDATDLPADEAPQQSVEPTDNDMRVEIEAWWQPESDGAELPIDDVTPPEESPAEVFADLTPKHEAPTVDVEPAIVDDGFAASRHAETDAATDADEGATPEPAPAATPEPMKASKRSAGRRFALPPWQMPAAMPSVEFEKPEKPAADDYPRPPIEGYARPPVGPEIPHEREAAPADAGPPSPAEPAPVPPPAVPPGPPPMAGPPLAPGPYPPPPPWWPGPPPGPPGQPLPPPGWLHAPPPDHGPPRRGWFQPPPPRPGPGHPGPPPTERVGSPAPDPQSPARPGWVPPPHTAAPPPNYRPPQAFRVPTPLDEAEITNRNLHAPQSGWRRAVHKATAGHVNPGESRKERRQEDLLAQIRQPIFGDFRIAVLSIKGGVGKTTTTMGLGSALAMVRHDRVIAVDANPDRGTLAERVRDVSTRSTVRDLLSDPHINSYADVRNHTRMSTSRLEVLASEQDPAVSEVFGEDDYRRTVDILRHYYNVILTDCGTGIMHSAMSGVLDLAHTIVLVSSPAMDAARSASATLDWLMQHGHAGLVREAHVVLSASRPGSAALKLDKLHEHFAARCNSIHFIPFDPHLGEGADIDFGLLKPATFQAYLDLAGAVSENFGRLRPSREPV
jgi:MinD-like ATPase involved in chromosome partitioning or flagellar assembly